MSAQQAAVIEARATVHTDTRRAFRIGLWIVAIDIVIRATGGNFANEWEGWSTALSFVAVALVEGLVGAGLVFGLLVRIGMRPMPGRNRPAGAALLAGFLGIASYVVFFTGLPAIVGAGALALGIEGVRRAAEGTGRRGLAIGGIGLAVVNIGFTAVFYAYEIAVGVGKYWI
jgi:hypothetical protein